MIDDRQVTPEIERSLSLVLIGGPAENDVARRIARRLPFGISRDAVTVGGRRFEARDSVLEMVRPSPFAGDRYVMVVAPMSVAGMHVWNAGGFWLGNFGLPTRLWDWTLSDGRLSWSDELQLPDQAWIASGVFDGGWGTDDRWIFRGDPKVRAAATARRLPPPGFTVAAATLDAEAGHYEQYPGMTMTIRREGDHLVGERDGQSAALFPETETLYSSDTVPGSLQFIEEGGKIVGARIHDGATATTWRRID